MTNNNEERFYNSFLFKLVNSFAGSKRDLSFSILVNLVLGILYAFRIWDKVAILFIFGIFLPLFYIIAIYRLIRIKNIPPLSSKVVNYAKTNKGNLFFMFFDIIILLSVGFLIAFNVFDYILVRIIVILIIPFLCLITLHGLINDLYDITP